MTLQAIPKHLRQRLLESWGIASEEHLHGIKRPLITRADVEYHCDRLGRDFKVHLRPTYSPATVAVLVTVSWFGPLLGRYKRVSRTFHELARVAGPCVVDFVTTRQVRGLITPKPL